MKDELQLPRRSRKEDQSVVSRQTLRTKARGERAGGELQGLRAGLASVRRPDHKDGLEMYCHGGLRSRKVIVTPPHPVKETEERLLTEEVSSVRPGA